MVGPPLVMNSRKEQEQPVFRLTTEGAGEEEAEAAEATSSSRQVDASAVVEVLLGTGGRVPAAPAEPAGM